VTYKVLRFEFLEENMNEFCIFGMLNSFPLDKPCAGASMAIMVLLIFYKQYFSQRDALLSQP
jgi:hypothetical protein